MTPIRSLLKRVHADERGAVSLETILIIGAVALPILIFLINVAWPRLQDYFSQNVDDLQSGSDAGKDYR
jgi:Flp pilus assembly pilin Flp